MYSNNRKEHGVIIITNVYEGSEYLRANLAKLEEHEKALQEAMENFIKNGSAGTLFFQGKSLVYSELVSMTLCLAFERPRLAQCNYFLNRKVQAWHWSDMKKMIPLLCSVMTKLGVLYEEAIVSEKKFATREPQPSQYV